MLDVAQIPTLETERLVLRAPSAQDAAAYQSFYADEDASAAYGGPLRPDQAWRVLAADLGHWALRGYGMWVVEVKQTSEVVGGCGLWWPEAYPRSELTWWMLPAARRKGFAREASVAVISFAYHNLGWELVETHMTDDNMAARRLVEALGGVVMARDSFPDGVDRDVFKLPKQPPMR